MLENKNLPIEESLMPKFRDLSSVITDERFKTYMEPEERAKLVENSLKSMRKTKHKQSLEKIWATNKDVKQDSK